jgi:soluble lytic murein transglycosylase-like protein
MPTIAEEMQQWIPMDKALSAKYGVPLGILIGQQAVESGGNPAAENIGTATLPSGRQVPTDALGLAQFEPATWAEYGAGNPLNALDNATAEAKYLHALHEQYGNWDTAILAYGGFAYPHDPTEIAAAAKAAGTPLSAPVASQLESANTTSTQSASTKTATGGFWAWLHRYAWILIIPGAALIWLGIKKIVG